MYVIKRFRYNNFVLSEQMKFTSIKHFCSSNESPKNPYKILEIDPLASQSEIKQAYYDKTLKYHPDRNEGSLEAADRFKEVTEAYEILGNVYYRERYDRGLPVSFEFRTRPVNRQPIEHYVKYQKFYDSRTEFKKAFKTTESRWKWDDISDGERKAYDSNKKSVDDKDVSMTTKCTTLFGILLLFFVLGSGKYKLD